MNFLIENKNNANQNSKFLTIITNYLNSKNPNFSIINKNCPNQY